MMFYYTCSVTNTEKNGQLILRTITNICILHCLHHTARWLVDYIYIQRIAEVVYTSINN